MANNYQGVDSKLVNDALDNLESNVDTSLALKVAFADIFVSGVLTGTGAAQNVAHGLGVVPSKVLIVPVVTAGPVGISYGVNTSTNVVTTVTAGDTFKVIAIK